MASFKIKSSQKHHTPGGPLFIKHLRKSWRR